MKFLRQEFERIAELVPQLPRGPNAKGASPVSSPPQAVFCTPLRGAGQTENLLPVSRVR
jgi:hypothetical protein